MIRENQKTFNRLQLLIDLAILVISLFLAYWLRFIDYSGLYLGIPHYIETLYLLIPLYFILYNVFGLYEPRRRKLLSVEIVSIIKTNLLSMAILLSILFFLKEIDYSRQVFILFILLNCLLTISERVIVRLLLFNIRKKGYNVKYLLIVGGGSLARKVIRAVKENKSLGYQIVGILDDHMAEGKTIEQIKIIGDINGLEAKILEHHIDEIIIALPLKEYDKLKSIVRTCEKSGVRTQIIPEYAKYIPARPLVDEIDGIPLINIRYIPLDNVVKAAGKRLFDIVMSCLGIVICLPIFLIVSIAIKSESPGPILFKQERIGLNRKPFSMYKFRSMKVQEEKESDTKWTTKDDDRKTRVGTFIRKTSIDELPQLFNVLKGDMSIVGPRPERPFFVEQFKEKIPKYMIKHQVRPGITGWAQVNGWRGDTSIRKRIECDLYYIENWTFLFDIKIILLTVFKGLINKNAY